MHFRRSLLFIFFIICQEIVCAGLPDTVPAGPVIYGHYKSLISGQQLQIQFYDYFFRFNTQGNLLKISCPISPDDSFKFILPFVSHPAYFSLVINPGSDEKRLLELYIIEPDDSVEVNFNNNSIVFSGRGATKYDCRQKLDQMPHVDAQSPNSIGRIMFDKSFKGNETYYQSLMKDKIRSDSQLDTRLRLIEKYKTVLNPSVYDLLKTDYIGQRYTDALYGMRVYYINAAVTDSASTNDSGFKEFIDFYKKEYGNWYPDTTNAKILVLSKTYDQSLISFSKLTLSINKNEYQPLHLRYSMQELYEFMEFHFHGILKERVLTGMMVEMFNYLDDSDEYLEKSLHEVNEHAWWQMLEKLAGGMLKGAPVYPIVLPDSNNKPVNIWSFKGKVVVIDFWYTGCGACRLLAKGMKHVVEHYKKDSNVVFLTISIDKDTEKWKKSLRAQSYAGPGEINMYTEGFGYEHPVIRHYNIEGYPKVIIVDKNGKIYSSHPMTPWEDDRETIDAFIKTLDEALKI